MRQPARALVTVVVASLAMVAPARGHDEPTSTMAGRLGIIRKGGQAKIIGKPAPGQSFDLPDGANDPTVEGATLHMLDLGNPTANEMILDLPPQAAPLGWRGLGNPPGSSGYKYRGAGTPGDPCKVVLVKELQALGLKVTLGTTEDVEE